MSFRLHAFNLGLRLLAKPRLRRTKEPEIARRNFAISARLATRPPPHTLRLLRPGRLHWIRTGACAPRKVILYFHGGGYVFGSSRTHLAMLGYLSRLTGVEVCAPNYALAPEAPFPQAFDDGLAAHEAVLELGYRPHDIVLAGDSAGGGLSLAILGALLARGQAPCGVIAFSPWCDLSAQSKSLSDNRKRDPMLPVERLEELVTLYMQGADPKDPRASPLFASFEAPPPVFIAVSDSEILRDDGLRMADHLRQSGGTVTLERHPYAPHVWPFFTGWIPEAEATMRRAARFAQAAFAAASR